MKPAPASLKFSFRPLEITGELHRYELVVTLTLTQPPAQTFRLKLLWPVQVRIVRREHLSEGEEYIVDLEKGRFSYRELWLDGDEPIFPGQSMEIIGPNKPAKLAYEYNDETYDIMRLYKAPLQYTLYLKDYMPMEGSSPFTKLEQF